MERKNALTDKITITIIYIIFAVGIAGHLISATYPLMLNITPYVLLILGHLLILRFAAGKSIKILVWIVLVFLFTFLMEVIGVKTGYIFGDYTYGDTLGPKILDVPVIIGFNWTFVILGAISLAQKITNNKYMIILLTGILSVIFDLVLEPAAIKLDYWRWLSNNIPLMNYVSWFLIACAAAIIFYLLKPGKLSLLPAKYFLVQLGFFLILRIILVGH